MRHPRTLPAFTDEEKDKAHQLLATRVAYMGGRKLEEGDWATVYCGAKGIPDRGWSNLQIDIMQGTLGVEHKMYCYRSRADLAEACGTSIMHPALTRSIRVPANETNPNVAMADVLTQYGDLIERRKEEVRKQANSDDEPDMRIGWLLWQESLRQFLYFEQEMLAPNPNDYRAEWRKNEGAGARKQSKSLWIYEGDTPKKRYSVTTEAGAKIQPYFDVPLLNDPNLYLFTVIGEVIRTGDVRVWVTDPTFRELQTLIGNLDTVHLSTVIIDATKILALLEPVEQAKQEIARSLVITQEAYDALRTALPSVSDELSFQLLAQHLRNR